MQLGKLHLVLVHLPIALVVAAATADLLWAITRRKFFDNAGLYCLLGALATAPLTALAGSLLSDLKFKGHEPALSEQHETAAYIAIGLIAAATAARVLWRLKNWKWLRAIYALLIVASLVTIAVVGHLGGQLAFGVDYLRGLFGG
jgi:uncharacterized membrane protein